MTIATAKGNGSSLNTKSYSAGIIQIIGALFCVLQVHGVNSHLCLCACPLN